MFGQGFSLSLLIETIKEVQPQTVILGTHHYLQLSESALLQQTDPKNVESVKLMIPVGAAAPSCCQPKIQKVFTSCKVWLKIQSIWL